MTLDVDSVEPIIPCVYYNCDELIDAVFHDSELLIFTHNIRSFNRNFDNLSLLLDNIKSNIGTKTKFLSNILPKYKVIYKKKKSNILPDFTLVEENGEICAVEVIPDKGNPNSKCTVLGICLMFPYFLPSPIAWKLYY